MIDMHSHYLPAMDDGADDLNIGLQMLTESYDQGVSVCVATPHCVLHKPYSLALFLEHRAAAMEQLKRYIQEKGTAVPELLSGAEIYLDHDISLLEDIDRLCLEDTKYLLTEMPMHYDKRVPDWLYNLNLRGLTPIIAHVERYPFRETLLADCEGLTLVYQINASIFLSFSGKRIAKKLIAEGLPLVIGSDMHNLTTRPCNLQKAYKSCQKKFGTYAPAIFETNAKGILK